MDEACFIFFTESDDKAFERFMSHLRSRKEKKRLVFQLNGLNMKQKGSMLHEFASVLGFPSYFGGNYDALEDCLRDLGWLTFDSIVLCVENSDALLSEAAPKDRLILEDILRNVCSFWNAASDTPEDAGGHTAKPFHILTRGHTSAFERIGRIDVSDSAFEAGVFEGW
jgi:RNAse (barnase) inhibitor barstar